MRRSVSWVTVGVTALVVGSLTLAGCSTESGPAAEGEGGGELIGLIMKTNDVPFWQEMRKQAEQSAAERGLRIQVFAGADIGDNESQVAAIETLISAGAKGIMITPADPQAIVSAIDQAKAAGIAVVALDTPTVPADAVDATFATDNYRGGQLIGEWARKKFENEGTQPRIALIDYSADQIVVDVQRDQGFLEGFGIDLADPAIFGDETDPRIVGRGTGLLTLGDSRTAMENLLQANPDLNLVYTVNETTAFGAIEAIKAAGKMDQVTVVSIDGGCEGMEAIKRGELAATAQQFPRQMSALGVDALAKYIEDGTTPSNEGGKDATDSGTKLITDDPQDGVDSESVDAGLENCF